VITGSVLGYFSFRSYNTKEFLGLAEEKLHQKLSVDGMNRFVRHPLYFSTLIVVWGVLLLQPTREYMGVAVIITIYLIVGTKLEEKKLLEIFGQEYRNYQKQVPMLIPFLF
jgi:protein-S-isoprenylcysteine O-methyltransferase Ste14